MIDPQEIISQSIDAFRMVGAFHRVVGMPSLNEPGYSMLHREFITPLDVKIDAEQFKKEIPKFENYFQQWGKNHSQLPRTGLALVNETGRLIDNDPVNGSLMERAVMTGECVLELDFKRATPVMDLPSLKPLNVFHGNWYRSNILKWEKGAEFIPHIDTIVPSYWLRLWGTTDPDNMVLEYHDGNDFIRVTDIEPGRIYIIDTSKVHKARCTSDSCYQFFLSVSFDALPAIQQLSQDVS